MGNCPVLVPVPVLVLVLVAVAVLVGVCEASGHLAEHLYDADQETLGLNPVGLGCDLEQSHDVQDGAAFHRRTARDTAKSAAVGGSRASATAFGDVQRDRHRCPPKLIRQRCLASREALGDSKRRGQKLNRALVDIQFFVAQHAGLSAGRGTRCFATGAATRTRTRTRTRTG